MDAPMKKVNGGTVIGLVAETVDTPVETQEKPAPKKRTKKSTDDK